VLAAAIVGHGHGDPVQLWMLHEALDFELRRMIATAELNEILADLAADGRIHETARHLYVDGRPSGASGTITPVTEAEWRQARTVYSAEFMKDMAGLPNVPNGAPAMKRIDVELAETGSDGQMSIDELGERLTTTLGQLGLTFALNAGKGSRHLVVWSAPADYRGVHKAVRETLDGSGLVGARLIEPR